MTKGDVITIPANTPHWFKEIPTQTIAYYAVNIEKLGNSHKEAQKPQNAFVNFVPFCPRA